VNETGSGPFCNCCICYERYTPFGRLCLSKVLNSKIPNFATNRPTDIVNSYFGRGFILEGGQSVMQFSRLLYRISLLL
jgi:hypothetical protein